VTRLPQEISSTESIDVVYTWVDDSFPGYLELLNQYAKTKHDLNPNRTRDNMDLIKYSLRSLEQHLPWVRNIYLFTCRPQVPQWMNKNAEGLHIVHHDEVIDPQHLPTFSSLSIISNIHKLPGLSDRFLYIEDDMLFANSINVSDFYNNGKIIFYPQKSYSANENQRNNDKLSPWNLALAQSNHLLNKAFTSEKRRNVNHVPLFIERETWSEMEERWSNEFDQTKASRFRAKYNIAPEYLYPYFMAYTQRGKMASLSTTQKVLHYHPMENYLLWAWYGIWRINQKQPKFLSLNDNFDDRPHAGVVKTMKNFLETRYPMPSRFERSSNAF